MSSIASGNSAGDVFAMTVALKKKPIGGNMKNLRLAVLSICTLCIALFITSNTIAQSDESGNPKISSRSVFFFGTTDIVPNAGSTLFRSKDGVFFTFHTQGLPSGDAVTLWMAIFNNPEYCATSPCTSADFGNPAVDGTWVSTGGRIIGPDGSATFGAFRAVGDATGARPGIGTGNGIVDPLRAEIHLATRTHGPANLLDSAVLSEQLTTFNGGCPPNVCKTLQVSFQLR